MRIAQSLFFFLLMPIYLSMVYYKTVYNIDINGLLAVSALMLIVYLPFSTLLSQSNSEVSIHSLLENEEAKNYLNILLLYAGLYITLGTVLFIFGTDNFLMGNKIFGFVIAATLYAVWVLLTHKLFLIWLESDLDNFLKITFMLLLTIGLFIGSYILDIRQEFGFTYIMILVWTIVKVIFTLIFIMPSLVIFSFGLLGGSQSKGRDSISLIPLLFTPAGILFSFIVFTLFVNWFSGFVNSFNSYAVALTLSISMIIISALGTYFQLQVFMGTFFQKNAKKLSYVFLGVFYAVMMIHMNLVDSIDITAEKIDTTQKKLKKFNESLQHLGDS